jgi:hypothetical protein
VGICDTLASMRLTQSTAASSITPLLPRMAGNTEHQGYLFCIY